MSLIAFTGVKGAPGATTAAIGLAAVWPVAPILADFDPVGGDVALRLRDPHGAALDATRGVVSLAAELRHGQPVDLTPHLQAVNGGLSVLAGLSTSEQSCGISDRWRLIASCASSAATTTDVLADCGRLAADTVTMPLLDNADVVVVVTAVTVDALTHARRELRWLLPRRQSNKETRLAVLPVSPHTDASTVRLVRTAFTAGVRDTIVTLPPLAFDADGVAVLRGEKRGQLNRSWLVRSARAIAASLRELATQPEGDLQTVLGGVG
ncbi:MAG TPA: hypothetical protein VFQ85_12815 [Mycobacteriales bacterium]|jgi:MinD-like ATPase involved in chromosome partitioning or flagellar assembly|nr:hypothetical protein [Mycobacteriales bacterium]